MRAATRQRLFDWIFVRFSRSTRIDGLWVGVFDGRQDAEILEKVGEALKLIETYDSYRYARVLKECDRLLVRLLEGNVGQFRADARTCEIDTRYVLSYSPERLASLIVHESTHGRLLRLKIGYTEELRHRVERACVRQELAFATKLPNGEDLRKTLTSKLSWPATTWTDEAFRKRHRDGSIGLFRHVGVPDWLIKIMMGSPRES
jgi:hypothetical protein